MELLSVFELMPLVQGPGSEWAHWPFGPSFVGGWLNMLTKFIFIGLVLALMMYLLRYLFGPGGPMREDPPSDLSVQQGVELALGVLRRRLDEGKIDAEEFERIKNLLQP